MIKKIHLTLILMCAFALSMPAQVVVETEDAGEDIELTEEEAEEDIEEAEGEDEEDDADDEDATDEQSVPTDSVSVIGGVEQTEGMSADIDDLLRQWHAQQYIEQSQENGALYPAEPILADSATYVLRLRRLPVVVDMPYNDIVKRYIEQYAGRLRRSVSYMLGAQNFYIPIFEDALEACGVPLELKYLPIIESALNPNAVSRVGATGLWQFMMPTAHRYGLEENTLTDDRRDPVKSTWAAARYLHDLYEIYKDWALVIAAYNCGPTNVNKAIHRAGGSQDYWKIYPYLPHETRGYVPAFIAANYIMNYYCEHGIRPMATQLPLASDTVVVHADLHFQQVADLCKISVDEIRALNPQYRHDIVPGLWRPSALRLPQEAITTFIDLGDSIYAHRAEELLPRRSTVTVNTSSPTPVISKAGSRSKSKSRHKSSSRKRSVTVRKGDTLSTIARRNGTTVAKLKRLNGISGSNIRAGKKIRVK